MADETKLDRLLNQQVLLTSLLGTCEDGSKAAALSRELRALEVEIEKAGGARVGSELDDLAARRAARISEAPSADAPTVRKRGRRPGSD